ncbi:MAG: hypothetical protein AAFY71_13240 [Bacteroidota bacterium]
MKNSITLSLIALLIASSACTTENVLPSSDAQPSDDFHAIIQESEQIKIKAAFIEDDENTCGYYFETGSLGQDVSRFQALNFDEVAQSLNNQDKLTLVLKTESYVNGYCEGMGAFEIDQIFKELDEATNSSEKLDIKSEKAFPKK